MFSVGGKSWRTFKTWKLTVGGGDDRCQCRLIAFIWFSHGFGAICFLFFGGINCFTKRLWFHLFLPGPSMHGCGQIFQLLFQVVSRAPKGAAASSHTRVCVCRQSRCRSQYRLTPASPESSGGFLQHSPTPVRSTPGTFQRGPDWRPAKLFEIFDIPPTDSSSRCWSRKTLCKNEIRKSGDLDACESLHPPSEHLST